MRDQAYFKNLKKKQEQNAEFKLNADQHCLEVHNSKDDKCEVCGDYEVYDKGMCYNCCVDVYS